MVRRDRAQTLTLFRLFRLFTLFMLLAYLNYTRSAMIEAIQADDMPDGCTQNLIAQLGLW